MAGILDMLSQLFSQGQTASGPLGAGMAQNAVTLKQIHPEWQSEMAQLQMNGQPPIPIDVWARAKGYNLILPQ